MGPRASLISSICFMSSLRLTDSTLHANVFQLPASVLTTDYDTGVLLLTLQGLVNRNPHTATPLILNTLQVFNQFYGADAHWIEYLESTKNVTIRNLTFSGINGLLDAYWARRHQRSRAVRRRRAQ